MYICVVEILEWPNISWIVLRSAPLFNKWVANECLNTWGDTFFSIPHLLHSAFNILKNPCLLIFLKELEINAVDKDSELEEDEVELVVEILKDEIAATKGNTIAIEGKLHYNLTPDEVKIMLLEELSPKKTVIKNELEVDNNEKNN